MLFKICSRNDHIAVLRAEERFCYSSGIVNRYEHNFTFGTIGPRKIGSREASIWPAIGLFDSPVPVRHVGPGSLPGSGFHLTCDCTNRFSLCASTPRGTWPSTWCRSVRWTPSSPSLSFYSSCASGTWRPTARCPPTSSRWETSTRPSTPSPARWSTRRRDARATATSSSSSAVSRSSSSTSRGELRFWLYWVSSVTPSSQLWRRGNAWNLNNL